MQATIKGRVVEATIDKETGALKSFKVESMNGMLEMWKPDSWCHEESFKQALGENVIVTITVEHD